MFPDLPLELYCSHVLRSLLWSRKSTQVGGSVGRYRTGGSDFDFTDQRCREFFEQNCFQSSQILEDLTEPTTLMTSGPGGFVLFQCITAAGISVKTAFRSIGYLIWCVCGVLQAICSALIDDG